MQQEYFTSSLLSDNMEHYDEVIPEKYKERVWQGIQEYLYAAMAEIQRLETLSQEEVGNVNDTGSHSTPTPTESVNVNIMDYLVYDDKRRRGIYLEDFENDTKNRLNDRKKSSINNTFDCKTIRSGIRQSFVENVYDIVSWPHHKGLNELESGISSYCKIDYFKETFTRFANVYNLGDPITVKGTVTGVSLFSITPKDTNLFKRLLFGRNKLVLRLVPLFKPNKYGKFDYYLGDDDLDEIYNEVIGSYFLTELMFGYPHLLSIHFRMVFDWFILPRQLTPLTLASSSPESLSKESDRNKTSLYQSIVTEDANVKIEHYLIEYPTMDTLRSVIFELFHALEVAWNTFHFTHNDLGLRNIQLIDVSTIDGSPFRDKHFLYNRLKSESGTSSNSNWYFLSANHLNNHIVKIIDIGRARMEIPEHEQSEQKDSSLSQHVHRRLLFLNGLEMFGIWRYKSNRTIDPRVFINDLLTVMPIDYWRVIRTTATVEEWDEFEDLCSKILNSPMIGEYLRVYYPRKWKKYGVDKIQVFDVFAISKLNDSVKNSLVYYTTLDPDYLTEYLGDYKAPFNDGKPIFTVNVSMALDHPFFERLDAAPYSDSLNKSNTVQVSFSLDEQKNPPITVFRQSSSLFNCDGVMNDSQMMRRCSVCQKQLTKESYLTKQEMNTTTNSPLPVYYCNEMCHLFKHEFDCKTVLR